MLSTGRKRKRNEFEEDKNTQDYNEIKQQLSTKQRVIEELKSEVDRFENERIKLLDDQTKLAKLYEMGFIDDHGDPVPQDIYKSDEMD